MFLRYTRYPLLWALLIFILCLFPGKYIPSVWWLELLSVDKLVHSGLFFVLVVLMTRGFTLQLSFVYLQKLPLFTSFYLSVIYGGGLEIMQGMLFIGRTADVYDFIANAFGCVVALVFFSRIERKILSRWEW